MEDSGGASAGGRGLVTVSVLVLIGLVGLLAFLAGRDDPGDAVRRSGERFPATSTTSAPTTTTVVATTDDDRGDVDDGRGDHARRSRRRSGSVTSCPTSRPSPSCWRRRSRRSRRSTSCWRPDATTSPRPDRSCRVCATVQLAAPLTAGGRWERDGREISSSAPIGRVPPGFGECLSDGGARAAGRLVPVHRHGRRGQGIGGRGTGRRCPTHRPALRQQRQRPAVRRAHRPAGQHVLRGVPLRRHADRPGIDS